MTSGRRAGLWSHLLLAALAFVPLLRTAPGRVAADTKTYLYLDPGRLLERAASMWDPNIGLGTVTHQNIGYLFPMGPWYWVLDALGFPDWVAQRLWVATVMFAAGAGVLFLFRTLGRARFPRGAALAAACLYMLSPYVLHYAARISVLLLPWAALPWLVGLTQRALRNGGWRHPALFAIVVTLVGGVNATALVLAGLGPLLWLPFAVWVHREVTLRRALVVTARIGVLTVACSLWWIAGLWAQGGYGIDILRYTESVATVARTSLSIEVLRGLGYWFFYGGDKLGPWIEPGRSYTQELWLLVAGFTVPLLGFLAAAVVRWRYRAYFVVLVLVGTTVAVGAHPYDDPSPAGALFKEFATSSTAGLALRSTPRAVPLVVLGLAVLIGAGLAALAERMQTAAVTGAALVVILAVIGLPPLWDGDFIGENLQRPEDVPAYWDDAAAYLDGRDDGTRVLELPGIDFASYRWGNTVDPITPGMIDRPYVARELIPYGSPASADLLIALDRRLQEGVLDAEAVLPVARLLGVGDLVLRNDLQYERYRTARPRAVWDLLADLGPEAPVTFGDGIVNRAPPPLPLLDEVELNIPDRAADPPPVAALAVDDALPIVRVHPADRPVLLAGDGEGVVDAAAAGLLDGAGVVLSSAALADRPDVREQALDDDAVLVLTDTNRRRSRRWSTVRENSGATERAGQTPLEEDPTDNRLPVFPDAGDDAATVVEQWGGAAVSATAYGNPVSYTAEDRAVRALDGDPTTAWRVAAFSNTFGERLQVDLDEPVTTDSVEVVQPLTGPRNRFMTRVAVRLDGEDAGEFDLGDASRTEAGQRLDLGGDRTFRRLEIEVLADSVGPRARYDGLSGVGLAELRIGDLRVDEVVRLPRDLLDDASDGHDLAIVLSRLRSDPAEVVRSDEELAMTRTFELPSARSFGLSGRARVAAAANEGTLDALLGTTGATARSSTRLAGDLDGRASSAVDGDPGTAWVNVFGEQRGAWLEVTTGAPVTVDRFDLDLVTDGRHSVPTRLRIEADGQPVTTVDVPATTDRDERGATTPVSVTFPAVTATTLRVVVDDVRAVETTDWFSGTPITMPVGIAELGAPGVAVAKTGAPVDTGCRTDLLEVDGAAVGIRVADGAVATCDGAPLELDGGEHLVRAAQGRDTGIDLDRLVLASTVSEARSPAAAVPTVHVDGTSRTSYDLTINGADGPFWLVLGQSQNAGWEATVEGGSASDAVLADGFGNGWYVDPDGDTVGVTLRWVPQRTVNIALWLSGFAFVACLALAVIGGRRRAAVPIAAGRGPVTPQVRAELSTSRRPGPVATVVVALLCGAVAAVLVDPLVGAVALAVTLVAVRGELLSRLPALGAIVALGLAASYIVAKQYRNSYPPDFGWPDFFGPAHWLGWVAVVLLAIDVVVELVRDRSRPISGE